MKTVKVIAVEARKDKRKTPYNLISFMTPDSVMQNGVKIKIEPRVQRVTKYPESYLPDKSPQYGHDFKVGDVVAGDIITRAGLIPYPIADKATGEITSTPNFATHLVLGDSTNEEAFEALVWKEFNSRGKFLNNGSAHSAAGFLKAWGTAAPELVQASEDVVETQTL